MDDIIVIEYILGFTFGPLDLINNNDITLLVYDTTQVQRKSVLCFT